MNVLPREKQIQVINALVEGCSIRSIERMYDVHRDTVMRLMVRTGDHCMGLTAIHFAHYNLCRVHKTLRVTPAMAAGITKTMWEIEMLLAP